MILLDTHIWIWWVQDHAALTRRHRELLNQYQSDVGVSVFSCWEIAKLVERGRLELSCPLHDWLVQALNYPGVSLLELTPEIVIESTQLPRPFHRDPADQLLVASARIYQVPLVTSDVKILNYPHVKTIG